MSAGLSGTSSRVHGRQRLLLSEDRFFIFSRKTTIAVFAALVALLIVDLLSSRQSILKFDDVLETVYLELTTVIGWGLESWLLLGYVGKVTADIRARSFPVRFLHLLIIITQFTILAVLLYVIFDGSSEFLTQLVFTISSFIAVAVLLVFSIKLISWYNLDRSSSTSSTIRNIKDGWILLFLL